MRIWSLHPMYLDSKGLVALWREALLAKHVLLGNTKGYKNHPQLTRFKKESNPVQLIDQYLAAVYAESSQRGYNFNAAKFDTTPKFRMLDVTGGQVKYERSHLLNKLKVRDMERFNQFSSSDHFVLHPMFNLVEGDIEEWEVVAP